LKVKKQMLVAEETPWGNLEVWQDGSVRSLYIQDKLAIQSQLDMVQKEKLLLPHTRAMMSFLIFQPQPQSMLLLGLGGGSIIHFLTHWFPGLEITAVEINDKVVKIGEKYFALSPFPPKAQVNIEIADAFAYLKRIKKKNVNVMLVDLHDGDALPNFMHTPAFMARCFHHLSSSGVLVINLLVKNEKEFTDTLTALRCSFSNISLCMAFKNQKNILLFAFMSPSVLNMTQLQARASQCQGKYNIEFEAFVSNIAKIDAK